MKASISFSVFSVFWTSFHFHISYLNPQFSIHFLFHGEAEARRGWRAAVVPKWWCVSSSVLSVCCHLSQPYQWTKKWDLDPVLFLPLIFLSFHTAVHMSLFSCLAYKYKLWKKVSIILTALYNYWKKSIKYFWEFLLLTHVIINIWQKLGLLQKCINLPIQIVQKVNTTSYDSCKRLFFE